MGGRKLTTLLTILCVIGLFAGCGKKYKPGADEGEGADVIAAEPSDSEAVVWAPGQEGDLTEEQIQRPLEETEPVSIPELQTVYFDYDKYNLRPDAMNTLNSNLNWLRNNPDARVLIEGHCDERGSEEYNLSLGDKRAKEVMSYLIKSGIDSSRLYTISYGEEFPVDPGHNEEAWSKNRRAEFKVYQ
jgi:peptidoglycan-associated lipoprotein